MTKREKNMSLFDKKSQEEKDVVNEKNETVGVQNVSDDKDKQISELEDKVKELENNWKRALADYQNLTKRTQDEVANIAKYSSQNVIFKFLEILDHLEEAQKHLSDKGIELVIKLFEDALKNEGVLEMKRLNQKFDPNFDECVDKRPASAEATAGEGKEENIVVEVIRKGYLIKGKVLRPAKVIVKVKKNI